MRVAFDARSLSSPVLRGWDRYIVGLVGELVRQGIEVTLFYRESQPLHTSHVANLGCSVVGLPDRGGMYWEQVSVPLALLRGKFDLFHAPAEQGVPLAAPCPTVLTFHSVTLHSYADLIKRGLLTGNLSAYVGHNSKPNERSLAAYYQRAQVARASHILTPSDFSRCEVIKFLGAKPERVTTTHLAVHEQFQKPIKNEVDRTATLKRLGIKKPYLLYVGGYETHKNVNGLLQTFALVHKRRRDLTLVVVGSKSIPDTISQDCELLGLDPNHDVVFLANITDDLTDIYDDAEIMVSLSWRETFCLPALEAMTRGIPVVASKWGATPEVIAEAGFLVEPYDYPAASEAILKMLSTARKQEFQKKAFARAMKFSWKQTAVKTLAVYKLLKGKYNADQRSS
jgi:glycosyltransferase involved in cell wall biosynthesis